MGPTPPSPSASSSREHVRYERKFTAAHVPVREIELMVRLLPSLFRVAYPPRDINNLYFDTLGMSSYNDHTNGSANRQKTRIRWYGTAHGEVSKPVLEFKGKRGLVNFKRSEKLPPFRFDGECNGESLIASCRAHGTPPVVIDHLASRRLVLFNRYRRQYFETADRRVRLTIDYELQFADLGDRPHARRAAFAEEGLVVIELKYRRDDERHGVVAAAELPFRLDRLSKYIRGVQRLTGWVE